MIDLRVFFIKFFQATIKFSQKTVQGSRLYFIENNNKLIPAYSEAGPGTTENIEKAF